MENVKISFDGENESFVNISYKEAIARVNTYIPIGLQTFLIEQYCGVLVDSTIPEATRFIRADMELKLSVIEFFTNIELSEDFSLDGIVASGFYDSIIKEIKNYDAFILALESSVRLVLDFENAKLRGSSPYSGLLDKIEALIDNISSIDLDKESIVDLTNTLLDTQKSFNEKWGGIQPETSVEQAVEMLESIVEVEKATSKEEKQEPAKRTRKKKAE